MNGDDDISKFTSSLNKFISNQWAKVKSSSSTLKPSRHLDEVLEEEYETLLREIDYLTSEKSCYLSFKNDHFKQEKSSEDLTQILKNHSEEVLEKYISKHDNQINNRISFVNQNDLVNYITEIILERPKCNKNKCTCKPDYTSKDTSPDTSNIIPVENEQETAKSDPQELSKKFSFVKSNSFETNKTSGKVPSKEREFVKSNSTEKNKTSDNLRNTEIQTDDWNHDPNCLCGCCPKNKSEITTKSSSKDGKQLHDSATSDKTVLANCRGETVDANTSAVKLCVPENFEELLKNDNENTEFSTCNKTQDCACDAYDVDEAVKRGFVLPGRNICVQKTNTFYKHASTSSNETSGKTKIVSEKGKHETKKQKGKGKQSSPEDSGESTPRKKNKKETTGCFGSKKKKGCDESCQGIYTSEQSIQTTPTSAYDKNESANLYQIDKKEIETSTNSERGVQFSNHPSKEDLVKKNRKDKESSNKEEKATGRSHENLEKKKSKQDNEKDSGDGSSMDNTSEGNKRNKQDNKNDSGDASNMDKSSEGTMCSKCGRKKKDCNSGCRNTIIIPYAAGSKNTIPPGDAESLRMLIKMQNKDTNRQFNNIMAELNHQKSEIRRLNDMYQKMVENYYESKQRSFGSSSRSQSKKISNMSQDCECLKCSANNKPDKSKSCGCNFSNECSTNPNSSTGRSKNSNNTCNCINNSGTAGTRKFGPPNTAVAINMCDTCTVEIAANSQDKQRKEYFNKSKKIENVSARSGKTFIGNGDYDAQETDSISTIYKNEKECCSKNIRSRHEFGDIKTNIKNIGLETDEESQFPKMQMKSNKIDSETETDSNESAKKPKNVYSSRVLLWLKKSWITIKTKSEECRSRDKTHRKAMNHIFNFCKRSGKRAATGLWKAMRD